MKKITLIDNIKYLFDLIKEKSIQDKKDYIKQYRFDVAEYFGVKEVTVRTGWMYNLDIPTKYKVQETLISYTQKWIANKIKN
jgi:hypothetical protein